MQRCLIPSTLVLLALACGPSPQSQSPQATQTPALETPPPRVIPVPAESVRLFGSVELPNGQALEYLAVLEPADGNEGYSGKIDLPSQHVQGAKLQQVTHTPGKRIGFSLAVPGTATWVGEFDEKGTVSCSFTQGAARLPCSMRLISAKEFAERKSVQRRPQTPKGPFPYAQREVTYRNEKAGITIAGTLTTPEGKGPHPAVLLISGSGAQDRDETIFGHKPFFVLADSLTRAGVAVLRVDDRGIGGTDAGPAGVTTADFADDVRAGLAFLRAQPQLDPRHLGLIGHSEGGMIAPMVAAENKAVDFVVMLAGTGVSGREVLSLQSQRFARAGGASEQVAAAIGDGNRAMTGVLLAESDPTKREAAVTKALRHLFELQSIEPNKQNIRAQLNFINTAWFRYFLAYDPAASLRKVTCPVLAINGTLDLQVDAEQNLPAIRKALARNRGVTIKRLRGLNHLFQRAQTGSVDEYATIEHTFDVHALKLVTQWVVATAKR